MATPLIRAVRSDTDPEVQALHPHAAKVLEQLAGRYPWEPVFLSAVEELFRSIGPALAARPEYISAAILERLVEPERVVSFRVPWTDDRNAVKVERGWRVQFNSALGPYKGGLRFHASTCLDTLKFLAFEQTLKNALTSLNLGGGKGGSDFDFRNRSDAEIMRFCQSFMTELYRHIGAEVDVPAGDIGVGGREIGYLFGQLKRITGRFNGAITGKGLAWGGSALRPEATGYGVAYFTEEVLKSQGQTVAGRTFAVSGFGNVAWGTVKKVTELGGRVVTLSGPDGFVHDEAGVSGEKIDYMLSLRRGATDCVAPYAERFGVPFVAGRRPWEVPCDVAIPCAVQNELDQHDAATLIKNGCGLVVEAANMPTTHGAVKLLQHHGITFVPGKAANAGGVAVSAMEMAQNGTGESWSPERVDASLRAVMHRIHAVCLDASASYGSPGDYLLGANIGGFLRVADAMLDQGIV